ncbi:MAG: DUF4143 domain-containing protein [Opitutales bacterium]
MLKGRYNRWKEPNFYFWRENNGLEVDILADQAGRLAPIEIKSGATVSNDWFQGLERWRKLAGEAAGSARLIYGGDDAWVQRETELIPWSELDGLAGAL